MEWGPSAWPMLKMVFQGGDKFSVAAILISNQFLPHHNFTDGNKVIADLSSIPACIFFG
jgi:prophage maintenance system killer protein